jgi:hypothetical protein
VEHVKAPHLLVQAGARQAWKEAYVTEVIRITRRRWTAAEDDAIRDLYEQMPTAELARRLDRTEESVRIRAQRMGVGKQEEALQRMRATLSAVHRQSRVIPAGFAEGTIPAEPPLSQPAGSPLTRKTFITRSTIHGYFSIVTTTDQAYILGLLAADGNVSSSRTRVNLGLQARDMRAVEFARDRMNPAASLSWLKDGRGVLQVTSRQMVADLEPFGIVPRKSRTLPWPARLGELQQSFLLGYFDGDGSMFLPRDRHERERPGWTVCSGSEQFLISMRDYILTATGVQLQAIQHRAGADLWQVAVTGLGAVVLGEWLHQDGLGLERKRFPERVLARYLAA